MNQDAYDIAERLPKGFVDKFNDPRQGAWRIGQMEKNYTLKVAQGLTSAQAQYYVLTQMQALKQKGQNARLGNFAERMRAEVRTRIGAYGEKARPLSEAQFKAALEAY